MPATEHEINVMINDMMPEDYRVLMTNVVNYGLRVDVSLANNAYQDYLRNMYIGTPGYPCPS
jgi:hypothetical protein